LAKDYILKIMKGRNAVNFKTQNSEDMCESCGNHAAGKNEWGGTKILCQLCHEIAWKNFCSRLEEVWKCIEIKKPLDKAIAGYEKEYEEEIELYRTYGGD